MEDQITQHVTAKNDMKTAIEMEQAIDSIGGVTGSEAANLEINSILDEESNRRKTTWKGMTIISNINIM